MKFGVEVGWRCGGGRVVERVRWWRGWCSGGERWGGRVGVKVVVLVFCGRVCVRVGVNSGGFEGVELG
uniref:Uncharacterized protein n=1 Tax=Knipowitschia caucasica TaxID=637954 RepID=A0AAV2JGF5_KNICA